MDINNIKLGDVFLMKNTDLYKPNTEKIKIIEVVIKGALLMIERLDGDYKGCKRLLNERMCKEYLTPIL